MMRNDDEYGGSRLIIDLGDKKVWAIIAVLVGAQFGAGQLATLGVNATAEKAVAKQDSIDEKLEKIRGAQDQFIGEVRYRLGRIEGAAEANREETQTQIRDLRHAVEGKGKRR